jgi:ring-1,2-phenylacetyl-CoA epoxidase subunit PaaC
VTQSLVALLIGLGDDELVLGHRHSEWTGFAPHIEEDVAFASIAQDEIGHAAAFYGLVSETTGDDPDGIALGREPWEYRHAIICELDNRDWAYTLARHWLYDGVDAVRLECLEDSRHRGLARLAGKIRREERYHTLHADTWMKRLAGGPVEGRTKLAEALAETLPQAQGLFEPFELESDAVEKGWLPLPSRALKDRWTQEAMAALDEMGLSPEAQRAGGELIASSSGDLIETGTEGADRGRAATGEGGRRGRHTKVFDSLWGDMTKTFRAHPGARW